MPGEGGYSLIKLVRSLGAASGGDIPAIALTAYARGEDRIKAVAAGFQMHVAKPVEPIELVTMIAALAGDAEHKTVKPPEWLSLLHDKLARIVARILYARETSKPEKQDFDVSGPAA